MQAMPAAPTGGSAEKLLTARQKSDIEIITRVYRQQKAHFENNNPHYGLKRIKARTKLTEILYIFFGIHTANAVQLVRREVNEIAQAA